jgi:hypothetical protein
MTRGARRLSSPNGEAGTRSASALAATAGWEPTTGSGLVADALTRAASEAARPRDIAGPRNKRAAVGN